LIAIVLNGRPSGLVPPCFAAIKQGFDHIRGRNPKR
jgi:hypothetical protein